MSPHPKLTIRFVLLPGERKREKLECPGLISTHTSELEKGIFTLKMESWLLFQLLLIFLKNQLFLFIIYLLF